MDNLQILSSIRSLAADTPDAATLLSAIVALFGRERAHYNWVGVYLLQGREPVLGPFVGRRTPHIRIPLDPGICGAVASSGETIVVDDVHADSRYLACSLETHSEIIVPITHEGRVLGEIDIDSDAPGAFTGDDRALLEGVAQVLADALVSFRSSGWREFTRATPHHENVGPTRGSATGRG